MEYNHRTSTQMCDYIHTHLNIPKHSEHQVLIAKHTKHQVLWLCVFRVGPPKLTG